MFTEEGVWTVSMGQRVVYFSDLTNKVIADARGLERIVVVRHPALRDGPVELEASEDEIESIRGRALRLVSLMLPQDNGSPSETVTIDIEEFNKLAGDRDMAEVLRQAESADQPHEQNKPATVSTNDGLTMPVVASPEKTLTMPVVVPDEDAVTVPAAAPTAQALPKPADASAKEGCGIWPWLAGLGLALVVLGVLAWTGLLSSLGAP
jgi:hypothetical protein